MADINKSETGLVEHPYQYVDEDAVPDHLICELICMSPLINPVVATCCGSHYCETCFPSTGICAACRTKTTPVKCTMTRDKIVLAGLNRVPIYCANKSKNCEWKGPRGNLKDHLRSCEMGDPKTLNQPVPCQSSALIEREEFDIEDEHYRQSISFRLIFMPLSPESETKYYRVCININLDSLEETRSKLSQKFKLDSDKCQIYVMSKNGSFDILNDLYALVMSDIIYVYQTVPNIPLPFSSALLENKFLKQRWLKHCYYDTFMKKYVQVLTPVPVWYHKNKTTCEDMCKNLRKYVYRTYISDTQDPIDPVDPTNIGTKHDIYFNIVITVGPNIYDKFYYLRSDEAMMNFELQEHLIIEWSLKGLTKIRKFNKVDDLSEFELPLILEKYNL